MTLTHGQTARLRQLNKANFTKLGPDRQVAAIRQWIQGCCWVDDWNGSD